MLRTILRHREVPVRYRDARTNILKRLLHLVEIDAMPRQETLPTMLAMVLMNQRHVVITAAIFWPLVEAVEFAESPAELLDFRFGHEVHIHALLELVILVGVLVRRAFIHFKAPRFRLDIVRL